MWRRLVGAGLSISVSLIWLVWPAPAGATSGTLTVTSDTTLSEDHHGDAVFGADGVTLDCAGFRIVGSIRVPAHDDVSIENCVVDFAVWALSIESSTRVSVSGVTALGRSLSPKAFGSIVVHDSSEISIIDSSVTGAVLDRVTCHPLVGDFCDTVWGVRITGGLDVELRRVSSSGNGNGLWIDAKSKVTVVDSDFSNNVDYGIASGVPSTFQGNTCRNNGAGSIPASVCDWGDTPRAGVGFFDPTTAEWHLPTADGTVASFAFGDQGDIPLINTYWLGVYRPSEQVIYVGRARGPLPEPCRLGNPGDIPLTGQFEGGGNLALYRPSTQQFFIFDRVIRNLPRCGPSGAGAADRVILFGNPGDVPVVGDWDGDGFDEFGLHRPSTGEFYWRNTVTTGIADGKISYGNPGDRFVAGDWGQIDGRETPGVFRPANITVYLRNTLTQGIADRSYVDGQPSWIPLSVDLQCPHTGLCKSY